MNALTEIKKKEIYKQVVPKWMTLFKDFYDLGKMVKDVMNVNSPGQGQVPIGENKDINAVIPIVITGVERAIDLWYETDIKLTTLKNEEKIEKLKKKQQMANRDLDDLRDKEHRIKQLENIIKKAEKIEAGEYVEDDDDTEEEEDTEEDD